MSAYLQMGHDSWNLLDNPDLGTYKGIIVSPVNDEPTAVSTRLTRMEKKRESLEVILDPQLYNPFLLKGQLGTWSYFPDAFATIQGDDLASWEKIGFAVVEQAKNLSLDAVCTPAPLPRSFSDEYYRFVVEVADATSGAAEGEGLEALVTAVVRLSDLSSPARALEIASILSSSLCRRVYLTFLTDGGVSPRDELNDGSALPTAVHLVRLLSASMRVQVAFVGHDAVLWKYGGAQDIASGKFWNLRRFSPGRWQEEPGGIKQPVPWWNEAQLLTCLRDQDVLRLDRAHWYDKRTFVNNPASKRILETLRQGTGRPWTAESWVQYLRWIYNCDHFLVDSESAEATLVKADSLWAELDVARILFDRNNDGRHVRTWLSAALEGGAR